MMNEKRNKLRSVSIGCDSANRILWKHAYDDGTITYQWMWLTNETWGKSCSGDEMMDCPLFEPLPTPEKDSRTLHIEQLETENERLRARVAKLEAQLAKYETPRQYTFHDLPELYERHATLTNVLKQLEEERDDTTP